MIAIPGGTFAMGSDRFYPEEAPARRHVTFAEIPPDPKDYPGMPPELALAGSAVFEMTDRPVDTGAPSWWHFRLGASWRAPIGPGSSIDGLEDHPVVHVSHSDAKAYVASTAPEVRTARHAAPAIRRVNRIMPAVPPR